MSDVNHILEQIEFLPPFPVTVNKALLKLKNPEVSTDEVADIIKFDQAVATNVLKLCNSSYFGLRRTVTNLAEALVYIGLSQLRKILILSGTRQYFENKLDGYELYTGELWRHSLATAVISDHLNDIIGAENEDTIFISALLHDIGKLVLSEFLADEAQQVLKLVNSGEMSFLDAENKVLHINHAELGGRILELWKFSGEMISIVRKHHEPAVEDDPDALNIIRIADNISMLMGFETSIDGMAYEGFANLFKKYDLNHEKIEKIMSESLEKIKKIEEEYGISKEDH